MNEDAGKVAVSAIDALKGNPLCLSLVVLVTIISLVSFYRSSQDMQSNERVVTELVDRCLPPSKR